jgi:hypothetical protein
MMSIRSQSLGTIRSRRSRWAVSSTTGGIVHDAGLSVEEFRSLL